MFKDLGAAIDRRSGLVGAYLAAALLAFASSSHAEPRADCPGPFAGQTLRWIVPYAIGGGYSTYSRLVAPFMEPQLDGHIVVENRVGAGGLIGSRAIMTARPDGRTIGIVNASGLLIAALTGMQNVPDVVEDYTVLGRITTTRHVWATGRRSGIENIQDAIERGETSVLVTGVRDVATTSFVDFVVGTEILGVDSRAVVGYTGTPDEAMAAVRGEVDIVVGNFESLLTWLESGDLRPILQISDTRISAHALLDEVPLLGGPGGIAAQRAAQTGHSVEAALEDAAALGTLLAGARIVVAPRDVDEHRTACLRSALSTALESEPLAQLATDANLSFDPAPAETTEAELARLARPFERFTPVVREAIARMRQ